MIVLVGALACYGFTYTLVRLDGPFDVLLWLRTVLGAYDYGENGRPKRRIGSFVRCPYCVGVWVGLGISCLLFPLNLQFLVNWWAVVGGGFFLQKAVRLGG